MKSVGYRIRYPVNPSAGAGMNRGCWLAELRAFQGT